MLPPISVAIALALASISAMRVPLATFRATTHKALLNIGHTADDATLITSVLEYAELRGNNQGVIKLTTGALAPEPGQTEIRTVFELPVSARLDGGRRVGMVVVARAVALAIDKAKATGVAVVGCSGYASATGALGYWARQLTEAGLIGVVLSQCNEMVAPFGSFQPLYGTNPLAIGLPTLPRAQVLDMATSAFAYYGVKLAEARGEALPPDVAYDARGEPTTSPAEALRGALRGFDRGVKGSHLGLMVELLAGAWTGAAMQDKVASANWGSVVLAFSPHLLGDTEGFLERAGEMCRRVKEATPLPNGPPIYLPGERGDEVEEERRREGVELEKEVWERVREMAGEM